jgi:hypothetical protein
MISWSYIDAPASCEVLQITSQLTFLLYAPFHPHKSQHKRCQQDRHRQEHENRVSLALLTALVQIISAIWYKYVRTFFICTASVQDINGCQGPCVWPLFRAVSIFLTHITAPNAF